MADRTAAVTVGPVTPAEMRAANRRLVSAMKRRDQRKKEWKRAETELADARRHVRHLLDMLARAASTAGPTCDTCGRAPLGANPLCLDCQAFGAAAFDGAGSEAPR